MRKVVLVTGASSGIGKATVLYFAKCGYDCIVHYYKGEKRALEVVREIEDKYLVKAVLVQGDVSVEDDVRRIIKKGIEVFGRIDVVVNNAGVAMDSDFSMKRVDDFRRVLDVNLIGPFLVSKYVAPYMKEVGSGVIINVGSTNGIDSYYSYSMDYDASKAGLHILTKDLAMELGPMIRVNAVAPGWVKTEMNVGLDEVYLKEEEGKIILGRFGEADEIAKVIYFLASDDASYINGTVLVCDGGRKN